MREGGGREKGKESGRRRKVIGVVGGPEPVELPLQLIWTKTLVHPD